MLKTQVGMMHKLHSLLLQQLKFKCSFTPLDSEDHDRLEKLLHETKFIFEEMKLIQSKVTPSSDNNCADHFYVMYSYMTGFVPNSL